MHRIWKSTTAGILSIVVGVFNAAVFIRAIVWSRWTFGPADLGWWQYLADSRFLFFVIGAVGIIGGYFALRRRRWRLALAGAICGFIPHLFILPILTIYPSDDKLSAVIFSGPPLALAILAALFIAQSRRDFA